VRTARIHRISFLVLFALRADCGRDARDPLQKI
jgi:hypothetical protein